MDNRPNRGGLPRWHTSLTGRFNDLSTSSNQFKSKNRVELDAHNPTLETPRTVGWVVVTDTETGMLPGIPGSATCVQKFDDSLNSAIHITYRISLRSSSLREPRYPLLKVVKVFWFEAMQAGIIKRWIQQPAKPRFKSVFWFKVYLFEKVFTIHSNKKNPL